MLGWHSLIYDQAILSLEWQCHAKTSHSKLWCIFHFFCKRQIRGSHPESRIRVIIIGDYELNSRGLQGWWFPNPWEIPQNIKNGHNRRVGFLSGHHVVTLIGMMSHTKFLKWLAILKLEWQSHFASLATRKVNSIPFVSVFKWRSGSLEIPWKVDQEREYE